jgi:hypothetical protein
MKKYENLRNNVKNLEKCKKIENLIKIKFSKNSTKNF